MGGVYVLQIIYLLTTITIFVLISVVFNCIFNKNRDLMIRMRSLSRPNSGQEMEELSQPFMARVIKPAFEGMNRLIVRVAPKEIRGKFQRKVTMAGFPYRLKANHWISIMAFMITIIPALTIGFGILARIGQKKLFLTIVVEICVGILLPHLLLSQKIAARKKNIIKSLPDVLDLLTVSVEAGLGFDGALAKVIEKYPGELTEEFSKVLQNIKMGKSKKDALKSMAERVNIPDVTTFISAVVQADQFGVGISNVLKIQSEQIRQKRRQRTQEKAMKAPVKMLIPMVFFIFPTIFSVLIGPIAIKMVKTFFK